MRPARLILAAAAALLTAGGVETALSAAPAWPTDERTRAGAVVVVIVDAHTLRARTPGARTIGRIRTFGRIGILGIDALPASTDVEVRTKRNSARSSHRPDPGRPPH